MINKEELKIGNLICYDPGNPVPVKVEAIVDIGVDTGYRKLISYENIFPIPITKEIVLGLGFQELPHFTVCNSLVCPLERNKKLSIGDIGTPNLMLWLSDEEDGDLINLHNWDYDKELYTHRLQNLMYFFKK